MTHTPLGYLAAWLDDADRQGDSLANGLVSVGSREAPAPPGTGMYLSVCGHPCSSMWPASATHALPSEHEPQDLDADLEDEHGFDCLTFVLGRRTVARAGHHRPAHHKEPP